MQKRMYLISFFLVFLFACTKTNKELVTPEVSDWRWKYTSSGIEITSLECKYPKNLVIPNTIEGQNVISIGSYAFINRGDKGNRIESVILPVGLLKIGEYAFAGNDIAEINFPVGLMTIGEYAFSSNPLKKIFLPWTIEYIGWESFYYNYWENGEYKNVDFIIQHKEFKYEDIVKYGWKAGEYAEPIFYLIKIFGANKIYLPEGMNSFEGWGKLGTTGTTITIGREINSELSYHYKNNGQKEGIYTYKSIDESVYASGFIWFWNPPE